MVDQVTADSGPSAKTKPKKKRKAHRPNAKIYGNNIVQLCKEKGMSQTEIADIIDVGDDHISRIVNNKVKCLSLAIAGKIAGALREPIEKVFILDKPKKE